MKKGFTLIELLAVIVILAIITSIAIPIVVNILGDTKTSAIERSAGNYVTAVENAIAQKKKEIRRFRPTDCSVTYDGNVLCDDTVLLEVNVDGEVPVGGVINFIDGEVYTMELIYDNVVIRRDETGSIIRTDELKNTNLDNVVYFDVVKGSMCSESEYNIENSNTGYNGLNGTGNQTSCLKFYSFLDNGGSTINLILDHNTTAVWMWYDGTTNIHGPVTALAKLKEDTDSWNGTITPSNVTIDNLYTIDYTGFKARLISAEEITQITGNTTWELKLDKLKMNWYYFATNSIVLSPTCERGNTSECTYRWLYDRTSTICKANGCLNNSDVPTSGYWTDTYRPDLSSASGHVPCEGHVNFGVSYLGRLAHACTNIPNHYGIRPVITVPRT